VAIGQYAGGPVAGLHLCLVSIIPLPLTIAVLPLRCTIAVVQFRSYVAVATDWLSCYGRTAKIGLNPIATEQQLRCNRRWQQQRCNGIWQDYRIGTPPALTSVLLIQCIQMLF